jgi:hypothetical protein
VELLRRKLTVDGDNKTKVFAKGFEPGDKHHTAAWALHQATRQQGQDEAVKLKAELPAGGVESVPVACEERAVELVSGGC